MSTKYYYSGEKRFYRFLYRIAQPMFGGLVNFEAIGREYIPREGGTLIMSNHVSYLDPIFLGAAVTRELHYMARDDLFRPQLWGDFLTYMNAFPVKRGEGDIRALRTALSLLEKNKLVLIFPEGTRGISGKLGEPVEGAGFIVHRTNVPVIPAFVKGTEIILPRNAKGIKRAKVSVYFGKPLELSALRNLPRGRKTYKLIAQEIMRNIAELKEKVCSNGK
jgi:1-acyl-sn-glycerol-3-phosphate acyltransferase